MANSDTHAFRNHVWIGGGGFNTEDFERNLLAFLERNDFSVVLTDYSVDPETAGDDVRDQLELFHDRGIDVWLGAGIIPGREEISDWSESYTDRDLLEDDETMDRFLDVHRRVAQLYAEYYPQGKLILWHEEPTRCNWTGDTRAERAESMAEYGPPIFAEQKRAVEEVAPDLDVGIFPHWTVMPDPEHTTVSNCEELYSGMKEVGALPDFTYVDAYRGYYEWAAGYEPTNEFLASIVSNIKTHSEGRPVYFLGECHTINNYYTPSKAAILGNLHATLGEGVESAGWYIRSNYRRTSERSFDPFLPTTGDVDENQFNSFTGARDRLLWSNLLLIEEREDFRREDAFDLWVYGEDFDFYEHGVSLQTADGDWEFLGDVSGYADGDTEYSGGGRDRVYSFHALERDRFLADGELTVRVESDGEATLESVYAMPYFDTGAYVTEPEATKLVKDSDVDVGAYALGAAKPSTDLAAETEHTVTVPASGSGGDPAELAFPEQTETYAKLADSDRSWGVRERFDLWVYGRNLSDVSVALQGESVDAHADRQPSDAFAGDAEAVVFRELDRDLPSSHAGGEYLDVDVEGDGELLGVYAMPAGGARNFRPDQAVAETVERDYQRAGQIENFCIGHQTYADGHSLPAETWLHIPNRRTVASQE